MTTQPNTTRRKDGRPRWRGLTLVAAMVAALSANVVQAQAPAAPPTGAAAAYSAQELEKLVDRIALYPDDLVAIILPAATNPLQIVQADRFLEKRKSDPKAPVDEKWDDAVKSLLNYPEVVKKMSADLDWTADLGEAVVTDQGAVLEAVQSFRRKTQGAGNLKSDEKQTVVVEKEVIKIVPANPEVIYVPQYNPTTVVVSGGYSAWGYYPSPYPVYYYPYAPGAAFATGLIWGAAISAAWHGGWYNCGWGGGGNNTINIDNSRNFQGGDRTRTSSGGGSQWKANKQPGQVSGSVGRQPSAGRVGDGARGGQAGGGRDMGGGGARPSQQPAGGRDFGGRDAGGRDAGGGAFAGAGGSGRDARMDSSRGASSRDSMGSRGGGSRPSAGSYGGGGGARAGGFSGGGGARGGGGGRGGRR